MALLYRAIWNDHRPDLLEAGREVFRLWLTTEGVELDMPRHGVEESAAATLAVSRAEDADVAALRISLHRERTVHGGSERCTTAAYWMTDGTDGWVWVDVERVSDDAYAIHPDVVAPELVGMLLLADGADVPQRVGPRQSRVSVDEVEGLVEWIYDDRRSHPVIVFSVDPSVGPAGYSTRVRETARRLAGCADVRMLTSDSERDFVAATHAQSMSVYDGAARIYMPGIDREDPQEWRHRIVPTQLLTERPATAAVRISRLVLPRVVAQRPPMLYRTRVKQLLDQSAGDGVDWQRLAEDLDLTVADLRGELERAREERDLALMEALDSEREAADALRRLDALRDRIWALGEAPAGSEDRSIRVADARSCAEAVALAAELPNLVIHPDAPRDVDRMDQSPDAALWGQRLWDHLQSLDAYAAEKGPGYRTWCETSGHHRAISSKFISMTESESVCQSPTLRRHRVLPIAEEVAPGGTIEMFAHIKSVQGGGKQIPRIYFHDDTKGTTGKIHIGFIGPHDLMPNLQTN